MQSKPTSAGGVIHTYQKYDPRNLPSPTQPPPDLVSGAFEHLLTYGNLRELTPEELARAVRIDPSQIAGLGPSLDALLEMLRERKRKILETYETDRVQGEAARRYRELGEQDPTARQVQGPLPPGRPGRTDLRSGAALVSRGRRTSRVRAAVGAVGGTLGDKYQVDELAAQVRVHRPARR